MKQKYKKNIESKDLGKKLNAWELRRQEQLKDKRPKFDKTTMADLYPPDEILSDPKLRQTLCKTGHHELVRNAFRQQSSSLLRSEMENRYVKHPCRLRKKKRRGW
jgi:hypothetical protein